MAVNKAAQRATSTVRPDPAPFQAVIDQGRAPIDLVLDAYAHVLGIWIANGGSEIQPGDVVQERPAVDPYEPPTLDALLIIRDRYRMWAEWGRSTQFSMPSCPLPGR